MYQSFIGLEVHIHLLTKTKVFCNCRSAFGDEPNTNICPVCLGYPGVLPSLNSESLKMSCMVAKALNCHIPEKTWFERKQYFYPDMTKNYQISQFASPLGQNGYVDIEGSWGIRRVRIHECHLEEDAGKMIHTGTVSLLDYNRAGVSLLEIVTEPDMETGEQAEVFIQNLRRMVRYLGVCDGNMEEGSLRADANVSINTPGQGLGRKVEIKNLNSSRFVKLGLNYEIERQGKVLDAGKIVTQETRLWNQNRDQTEPMRQKENAQDYRYFPEPDLPVFAPDKAFLQSVENALVELPMPRQKRFEHAYGLSPDQANSICEEKQLADYFEQTLSCFLNDNSHKNTKNPKDAAKIIANRILIEGKHLLNQLTIPLHNIDQCKLTPQRLAELVSAVENGEVSAKNAKQVMEIAALEDKNPRALIKEKEWEQITDASVIENLISQVEKEESETLAQARAAVLAGNQKRIRALTAFLMGKILEKTKGRADPKLTNELVTQLLSAPQ